MAADTTVIGLCRVKINGIYHVDVRNARWSVKRSVQQHVTGGGVRESIGEEVPSGSFDDVIPRDKALNWRALKNFSITVLDKQDTSKVIAGFEGCNWSGLDGSMDLSSANASKAISWAGTGVVKA